MIAGPVSAYKLNMLMPYVAEGFDPDEAVQLGLGGIDPQGCWDLGYG